MVPEFGLLAGVAMAPFADVDEFFGAEQLGTARTAIKAISNPPHTLIIFCTSVSMTLDLA